MLLEAAELLESKSPKADDLIQHIRPSLAEAVHVCTKAAGHEFNIHWQKQLMKAASFGKSVLDLYNSDDFVEMTETLRVLNAVRFYKIGLPLSYDQLQRLTPERLIDRLTSRHEYLLALRIAEYLRLPSSQIYVHWASEKVRLSTEDEESICCMIVQKLHSQSGISFEQIAHVAYDEGRARLATALLNHEPRPGKQVPLLLSMREDRIALDKAVESGDPDLIYHVLLHLRKKLPLASFFRAINAHPMATALVETSAMNQDTELLKDLYYQDDRRLDASNLLVCQALAQSNTHAALDTLKLATKALQDSKEPTQTFHRVALDNTTRLLKAQEAIEKELPDMPSVTGSSLHQTIFTLLTRAQPKRATKLATDFHIPDKQLTWLRLRAAISARHWIQLEDFAKLKKSPIGWEPFFNACIAAGNPRVAALFVPKCTGLAVSDRVEMWIKCGLVGKAAEEAFKAKDRALLEGLRDKVGGPDAASVATDIERYLTELGGKKR